MQNAWKYQDISRYYRTGFHPPILDHNRRGGLLFVDNGAVAALRAGAELDFGRVFDLYLGLAKLLEYPGQAAFVMPDLIGDQAATIALLARFRRRAAELLAVGVELIVPVHKGLLPLDEAYRRTVEALGTGDFRVGVPSRECTSAAVKRRIAVTQPQLIDFLAATGVRRIHLLGIGKHQTLPRRVTELRRRFPGLHVTTDSNHLRSMLNERFKAALAEKVEEVALDLAAFGGQGLTDWTEWVYHLYRDPAVLTCEEAETFASAFWPRERFPGQWAEVLALALDPEPDLRHGTAEDDSEEGVFIHRSKLGNYLEEHHDPREVEEAVFRLALRGARSAARRQARIETIAEAERRRICPARSRRAGTGQISQQALDFGGRVISRDP